MGDLYASCPVDRTSQEIRLLRLLPKNDEGIIECTMQTYNHDDRPPYQALSYTWGPNIAYDDIEINGVKIPVRENLWSFLHQQQLHGNHGPFWIDALCIQQSNVDERNHQVQMMGPIYKGAEKALVWLGKEKDDSDLALRFLKRAWNPMLYNEVFGYSTDIAHSILSFCKRTYWSRMWIVQEIMLACHIEIHCGPGMLEWLKLSELYSHLDARSTRAGLTDQNDVDTPLYHFILGSPAISIAAMKRYADLERNSRATFSSLLETYRDHKCEDIRDKVYALVGVERYSSLEVNYHKSVAETLLDTLYYEASRICWEKWSTGLDPSESKSVWDFGLLLKKVLAVELSETELLLHVERSARVAWTTYCDLMENNISSAEFFAAVALAR